jgi:hypothetical protein
LFRMWVIRRPQENRVEKTEHSSAAAGPEREHNSRRGSESTTAPQCANTKADVQS